METSEMLEEAMVEAPKAGFAAPSLTLVEKISYQLGNEYTEAAGAPTLAAGSATVTAGSVAGLGSGRHRH